MKDSVALERLRAIVEASVPAYLTDLAQLVNTDSGSYTKPGVDAVGQWLGGQLAKLGASVSVERNETFGDTLVATFDEGSGTRRALLVGHMDTVFAVGTAAARPFTMRDGRAFGPGVTDMKSGLLAGLYALRALRTAYGELREPLEWLPFRRLVMVCNPDEEIGSPVSTPVIAHHAARADVAIVLEAARANGDIVSSRKGIVDLALHLTGRAAHAGIEPEKGRHALLEAAHKTIALQALNGRWPGVTVNVGVLKGGTRPNVVPDSAALEVDVRAVTRDALVQAETAVREICATSTVPDVTCQVEEHARHWPMEKTGGTARLVEHARAVAAELGFELHDAATGGASDANTTAGLGVPTLDGVGPVGGLDHSPDEYLEVASIGPRITMLAGLLQRIAGDESLEREGRSAQVG
ncbi:M20/M25/M40 family metallo-hydrolase [soil metagenome]